jgi:hypothetical protein
LKPKLWHVALGRAVVAQLAHAGVDLGVVGDHRAAVAEVPRFFWMMKLVVAASLSSPILEAVAGGVDGLGVVLDDEQLVLVGDLLDGPCRRTGRTGAPG